MFRVEKNKNSDLCTIYLKSDPEVLPLKKDWTNRPMVMPSMYDTVIDRVYDFEVRSDDVYVVTMPKCGTTWMQELSWLIVNDFDFEAAKSRNLLERAPMVEICGIIANFHDSIKQCDELKSPRLIKSHLPAALLPKQIWEKKAKIIYVARNPKDAAVSYYHMFTAFHAIKGTKEEFLPNFLKGDIWYGPFWDHVLEFWEMRDQSNVFFTTYESMKLDTRSVILGLCKFLNKKITDDQLQQLIEHVSFDKMKANPAANNDQLMKNLLKAGGNEDTGFRFMRRGEVGSHKNELPEQFIKQFDQLADETFKKHNMKITDIFPVV